MKEVKRLIDDTKCLKACKLLKAFYYYEKVDIADIEYPLSITYKTEKWLIYMFYSCLLDYGMKSRIYHHNLSRAYTSHPELFDPNYVCENSSNKEYLLNIMRTFIKPRYPNVSLKKWISLSEKLKHYDSLLNTIKSFCTFEELHDFINSLKEYGQKTGGLLIRTIVDSEICTFSEEMDFIPLDRHDIKISYLCGVIEKERLSANEIAELSKSWISNAKKADISPSNIDKYLWEIGSTFCNRKECTDCPLSSICKRKSV